MKFADKKAKNIKILRKLERKLESADEAEKDNIEREISFQRKKINDMVDEQRRHSGLSSGEMIKQYPYY